MTDRRPHWTDDLIDNLPVPGHAYLEDEDIYAIIAAVEDWARWEHVPKGTLARLEQAEAAIARVRDVCADEAFWAEGGPDAELVRAVTVEAVFAALDGERDG